MIRMTGNRRIELSPYARQHWTPDDTRAAYKVMEPGERIEVVGKFPRGPWTIKTSTRREGRGATFAEALAQLTVTA